MAQTPQHLVIVGHGAAGLAAANQAAKQARERGSSIDITVVEKASQNEAGGNTRWSPSYIRMEAPDRLAPGFEDDMLEISGGLADPGYFRTLAENAPATMAWLETHGIEFVTPVYYLAAGPRRIQPVGGGRAVVETLREAAVRAGVKFRYRCVASSLVMSGDRVEGVEACAPDGGTMLLEADAVILASGGFQGDPAMMRTQFGPLGETLKLIAPGTHFDTGDGIRMAREQGAAVAGDWNGMHAEPVDPRSTGPAAVVLVYPYGIVVDRHGDRFFDEGAGLVHETWEAFARDLHFSRPHQVAYAIFDSRLADIDGYQRAIRSDVPPHQAGTLRDLAAQLGIPARRLTATVEAFNAAATGGAARFDATRCDGLATAGLEPPKSNWARPITNAPFLAYPLAGAVAYTFGGLATDTWARLLCDRGPMPGLYAAGEITGQFYGTAPNAVAMLRALVFGRIAGREAVDFIAGAGPPGRNENGF
jgi:tricarballylate dehydrogenase